ncbi:MAG: alpha-L-fucosidase [Flavobacteriaceae bacterium]
MNKRKSVSTGLGLFLALFFCIFISACKEKNVPQESKKTEEIAPVNYLEESKEDFGQRMSWWRDAKFGMFIHWGPYAVPAGIYNEKEVEGIGEWIMDKGQVPLKEYEEFAKNWIPEDFDAESWAKLMKEAGMKYVVITSKHHDGFALWDSKVSDYDITDFSPYGKDILKQLSAACKKEGIKFGLYHSIMDWHHPQAQAIHEPKYNVWRTDSPKVNPEFPKYVENYLKPQLHELITSYDPDIIWFDGEWVPDYTHEMGLDMYQYVRSLKPSILINNRVDKGRRGMMGMDDDKFDYAGDFGTPEQEILEGTAATDWESCMTMNDTWGFKKNDHNWKSTDILIHNLIDVTAKGGNYLLNVGPTAKGIIPQPSVDRLKGVGKWLSVNGEAIFDTEKLASTYKQGESIRYTKKKSEPIYYAISLEKPKNEIVLHSIEPNSDSKIHLLGSNEPLKWKFSDDSKLTIQISQKALSDVGKTEAWTFVIEGKEIMD